MDNVKVLLADDHEMILDGLQSMLSSVGSVEVVGTVQNGEEVLDKVRTLPELDVIIMDINMPKMDGIETTKRLKMEYPEISVLILTMYNRQEFVQNLFASGIDGYIMKNSGRKVLLEAIETLIKGEPYYGPEITKTIMQGYQKNRVFHPDVFDELSKREKEVIQLIANEMTTAEIAEKLFISTHTVDTHRKNVLSKLNVKNVAGIIKFAIQTGIIKGFDI